MIPYFSEYFGNPHSNNHEFGRSANNAVDEARANVANLIIDTFLLRNGVRLLPFGL